MNAYAKTKEEFIKFNNARELFKELYNVCMLFKNSDHWYYCNCQKLKSKCALCQFDNKFDDKNLEKYMVKYRHDVEKLQDVVTIYWTSVRKVQKEDPDTLDFFNKEYIWSHRDHRHCRYLSCDLEQIIQSNEEIINSSGLDHFFKHFI